MRPFLPLLSVLCAAAAAESFAAAAAVGVPASEIGTAVKAAVASPVFGGGLATPVITLLPTLFEPGWKSRGATGGMAPDEEGWRRFEMKTSSRRGAPLIAGRVRFAAGADGAVRGEWLAVPAADAPLEELFVGGTFSLADFAGGTMLADGRTIDLPVDCQTMRVFHGTVSELTLRDRAGADRLRVVFDGPTSVLLQDNRAWGGTSFSLRLFLAEGAVKGGREYALRVSFSTPADGLLALDDGRTVRIEAGADWVPLAGEPWIEPGSALDFTHVLPHHAPAGKFGRVVAVGDHFEFEARPGEPVRFYGVNLCGDANAPSTREAAGRFAANLARMGYNAVRFHHHERALLGGSYREGMDDTAPDPAAMDRFDALVAACVEHGIYVTTDLFVSRSWFTTWRSLGIDRDGCITSTGDYKLLCAFWEPAFTNLCDWSRAFLGHVNPHTGRSLAEEPALCALALVNEGNLGNWNTAALRDLPGVADAWRAWLAKRRNEGRRYAANDGAAGAANEGRRCAANEGGGSAANEGAPVIVAEGDPVIAGAASPVITAEGGPVIAAEGRPVIASEAGPVIAGEAGPSFDWDSIPDEIPDAVYADDGATPERRHAAAFAIFLAEREERLANRLRDFLRDELHCKAPISSLSCWYNPVQYQLVRERCFDYVDDHFYVDHPSFLGESWKLPSRCPNANPILGPGAGSRSCAFRRLLDKPFCITEWNYAGPGRYRGVGGIATGALGALQDWSGLWRFAWSHGKAGVETPEKKTMGYFDVSGDPLSLAAERAALCLFLRRDLEPLEAESPIVLDEAALLDPRNGAPKTTQTARLSESWSARVGTRIVPTRANDGRCSAANDGVACGDNDGRRCAANDGVACGDNDGRRCAANDGVACGDNDGRRSAANEGGGSAANEGAPRQMTHSEHSVITAEGGPVIAGEAGPVIAAGGRPVIAAGGRPVIAGEAGSVIVDGESGAFSIDTPRTAGGFAESGTHVAGPLTFTLLPNDPCLRGAAVPDIAGAAGPVIAARSAAPSLPPQAAPSLPRAARPVIDGGGDPVAATVWVSSLDGEPIARSSHLLLTHLTDVQNSGIRYADEALTILLDWGKLPHLMRRGAARIELALDANEGVACGDNDGRRCAANEGGGSAANEGAPRQVLNSDHSVIAGEAGPVIAAEGRPVIASEAGPVIGGKPAWRVFRLSPSGKRLGEVPFAWEPRPDLRREAALTAAEGGDLQPRSGDFTREAGLLRFTVDTALDPASATYLYEIVRDPDAP